MRLRLRTPIAWLAAAAALAGVLAAAAPASTARGADEPEQNLMPADQQRAAAISLQRADLRRVRSSTRVTRGGANVGLRCSRQPDLSDLTITGASFSPLLEDLGRYLVGSAVEVYSTPQQAKASFERQTARDVVVPCLGRFFIARAEQGRLRLVSARTAQTTTFGDGTVRYRFSWRIATGRTGRHVVPAYTDLYFVVQERVVLAVAFFSAPKYLTAASQQAIVARIAARA